ncbi:MAG: putative short-subunit dehydrogenase-like oxidoreductase (DUF2520 family) [Candidatus Aldehydirespiratoraceae bacterium]|jgi:predicted short-subunit dehydrogenase-like oxidoreductase (DUF2520 family)
MARSCVVVGSGRAGGSFHGAMGKAGWATQLVAARSLVSGALPDGPSTETSDTATIQTLEFGLDTVDLVLLAVPDRAIVEVARTLPATDAVVAHVSGACGLDVLAPHRRIGSIHPLMSLPDAATGSRRLLDSCTFAVDGDPLMAEVAASLGGRAITVAASSRALYHATASIAANHLVVICAQVESLAWQVGVPVDAYWTMMRNTLENVAEVGSAPALTGPAARADWDTIRAHLVALPTGEDRRLYRVLCEHAAGLAGHDMPGWWAAAAPK